MGYEQELSLTFIRPVRNEADAEEFQAEALRRIKDVLQPETEDTDFADGEASVSIFSWGRNIYDWNTKTGDAQLGTDNVSAKKLTRQLGCKLMIEYHGEERGDDDERWYEKGELVRRWENIRVEVTNSDVEEFNRIIDGIKKKGLGEEAERLRDVTMKMAARYLFSSSLSA
ncbi:MAG: hypothetical protein JRN45_00590 [Nitrososphaerota archaeon]|nr:hypothetical protein [Nitrososphaerota archaeon]